MKEELKALKLKITEVLNKVAKETESKGAEKLIKKASKSLAVEIIEARKKEAKRKLAADKKLAKQAFKEAVLTYAKDKAAAPVAPKK